MTTWKNRIVGHADVDPQSLLANPLNWRIHPMYQQKALKGVIDDIGFIKSVTVNQKTGHVVDGHLRVTLALRDGIKTIPVEYVDLSEAEEAEALLTIDPIAALAGSDKDNLEALLKQVNTGDEAVRKLLEDTANEVGLDLGKEEKDAEPQYIPEQYAIIIMCENEEKQTELLEKFNDEGLKCKALLS